MKKIIPIAILVVVVCTVIFVWWRYFFVFSEGVKAGELNYFEKKGILFKTYEGRVVQAGFKSPTPGELQSNEFRFSTTDEAIAKKLERAGGDFVELRYEEYIAPVPWRGASNYVIIEILSIGEERKSQKIPME